MYVNVGRLVIRDVRKASAQNNIMQEIADTNNLLRSWGVSRTSVNTRTSLSATHAAVYVIGLCGALWDRSTGQCVRTFDDINVMLLREDLLVCDEYGGPDDYFIASVCVYRTSAAGGLTLEHRFDGRDAVRPRYMLRGESLLQIDVPDDNNDGTVCCLAVREFDLSTGEELDPVLHASVNDTLMADHVHLSAGGKLCWVPSVRSPFGGGRRRPPTSDKLFVLMDTQTGAVSTTTHKGEPLSDVLCVPTDEHKRLVFLRTERDKDGLVVYTFR